MKTALISLNQLWEDKEENKKACLSFIQKSVAFDTDLVIFPEMTLTGFSMAIEKTAEDPENSETVRWFTELAFKNSVNIVFGVVFRAGNKAKNHLILVDKAGKILANYAKIHPFSFSDENQYFSGGDRLVTSELDTTKLGYSICYDLRFPELFQGLSKNCDVIINIANWPMRRVAHWRTLLQARAIENQVFMIGVNRTGTDGNNIEYEKSSLIYAPDGMAMIPKVIENEMDVYEIDIRLVKEIRYTFPLKKDRKPDFYKGIL